MDPIVEWLKHLGIPVLNILSIIVLAVALRFLERIRKLPESPQSKKEVDRAIALYFKKEIEPKLRQLELNHTTFTNDLKRFKLEEWQPFKDKWFDRLRRLWKHSGVSTDAQPAAKETVVVRQVAYVEQIREADPPRFHTGEQPVFVPATAKPPPPGYGGKRGLLPPAPIAEAEDSDPPDTPVTEPEGKKRR